MKDNLKSFRAIYSFNSDNESLKDYESAVTFFRGLWPMLKDFDGFLEWCFLSEVFFDQASDEAIVVFNQELVKRFRLQNMIHSCGFTIIEDSIREAVYLEDLSRGLMSISLQMKVRELIGERNELRTRERRRG